MSPRTSNRRLLIYQSVMICGLAALFIFAAGNTVTLANSEEKLRAGALREPQLADPASAHVEIVLPTAPLEKISAGFSGIAPSIHIIRLGGARPLSNVDPFEHPARRRHGRLDLTMAILLVIPIAFLPLFLILSRQIENSGALETILGGKASFFDFFVEKIELPLSAWLGIPAVAAIAALYAGGLRLDSNIVLARLLCWAILVALYLLVWLLLFAYLLLKTRDFAAASFRYAGVFLALGLVIPALFQSFQSAVFRPLERLPLTVQRRESIQAMRAGDRGPIDGYVRSQKLPAIDWTRPFDSGQRGVLMNLAAEESLRGKVADLDNRARESDDSADLLSWLSPTTVAQFGIDELAGTGLSRASRFRDQSVRYFETWKAFMLPRLVTRRFLDYDALRGTPKFRFEEQAEGVILGRAAYRCAYMLAIAAALAVLGARELRRILPKKANAAR